MIYLYLQLMANPSQPRLEDDIMIAFDEYVTNAVREDIEQLLKEEDEAIAKLTENMYNFRTTLLWDLLTILDEEAAALDLDDWMEHDFTMLPSPGSTYTAYTTPGSGGEWNADSLTWKV